MLARLDTDQHDLLTRDQFLDGLRDASVRLRVRYGTPKSLDDAIRIALEISAAEMAEQRSAKSSCSEGHSGTFVYLLVKWRRPMIGWVCVLIGGVCACASQSVVERL